MVLSGITLLWLLAVSCLLLGVFFTLRNRKLDISASNDYKPDVRRATVLVRCQHCGETMASDARFCGACGNRLYKNARQQTLNTRRSGRA